LQRLAKEKRVDPSMEALSLREPWRKLFTAQEINEANKKIMLPQKWPSLDSPPTEADERIGLFHRRYVQNCVWDERRETQYFW